MDEDKSKEAPKNNKQAKAGSWKPTKCTRYGGRRRKGLSDRARVRAMTGQCSPLTDLFSTCEPSRVQVLKMHV